jgi:hypothetical protein
MRRFWSRLAACLVPLLMLLGACATDEVGSDEDAEPGDPGAVSSTSQAIAVDEIMARAAEWVAKGVPYCGGVRGGTDYICGGTCQRPAAAWDNYRSDCSGFVSWCWQIASVPTTRGYMVDNAGTNGWHTIAIDDLKAGDAVVCDGHIKLFSAFVGSGSAEMYEEYNCGKVARKSVQSFSRSGNTMRFGYDTRTYHPIRRNGLAEALVVRGALDNATNAVTGWAVDLDAKAAALTVDAYFDGEGDTKKGYRVQAKADLPRPDVAKALGVGPNHGYSIPTPLFFCDALEHTVTLFGRPADGKTAPVLLGKAARPFKCPIPRARAGVLRHVVNPSSLGAWKFDLHRSLRWATTADREAYAVSATLPLAPRAGRTSDGAVWVVDGPIRRRVIAETRAAWSLAGELPALDAFDAKLPEGLPLPSRPVLVRAVGAPEIYLLDMDPGNPIDPGAEDGEEAGSPGADEDGDALSASGLRRPLFDDDAGGCSLARTSGVSRLPVALGMLLALGALRARRSRREPRAAR